MLGYNTAGQLGVGPTWGRNCVAANIPPRAAAVPSSSARPGQRCERGDRLRLGPDLRGDGPGAVECWGNNGDGQLGDGTNVDSSTPVAVQLPGGVKATAVAGGNQHMCALTSAGGVECWGYNGWGLLGIGTETGPQTCGENPCSTTPVAVHLPEGVTATAIASVATTRAW